MNIGKKLLIIGMFAYLLLGNKNQSKAGSSAEIMANGSYTTLDTKVIGKLGSKGGFFARNRVTSDYNNNVSTFLSTYLNYNLKGKLDGVFEVQATPENGTVPKIGLQYSKKSKNKSTYILATRSINKNPHLELTTLLKYTPKITKNVNGLIRLEAVTNLDKKGYNFNIARLRIGPEIKDYKLGFGLDATKVRNKKADYKPGFFIAKNF